MDRVRYLMEAKTMRTIVRWTFLGAVMVGFTPAMVPWATTAGTYNLTVDRVMIDTGDF